VVDDANMRRGLFSINALWKNKVAVLVGDFLLSQALLLTVRQKQYKMLEVINSAVREMAEGELLQMEKARRLDIEESVYYESYTPENSLPDRCRLLCRRRQYGGWQRRARSAHETVRRKNGNGVPDQG
jgi:hypothetical protein